MNALTRFLGGSPLSVVLRLALISFLVGVILAGLGLSPLDLVDGLVRFVERIFNLSFDAIERIGSYFLIGAVIVVPIFLVMRLVAVTRRS